MRSQPGGRGTALARNAYAGWPILVAPRCVEALLHDRCIILGMGFADDVTVLGALSPGFSSNGERTGEVCSALGVH